MQETLGGDRVAEDEDVAVTAAKARLAECDDRIAVIGAEVTAFRTELARIRSEYDALLRAHDQREANLAEADHRLSILKEERVAVQQRADEAATALADAEARIANQTLQATALERDLEAVRARLEERESSRAEAAEPEPARHVRLVSLPTGYALFEADEPAPSVGVVVELDGARFVVDAVGRSPLPGDRRACAFLLPIGSALPPSSEDVARDVADSSQQQHRN